MSDSSIPATMKSVVCYAPKDYRLEEKPVPVPKPGEVLVRVSACGICAGDSKCFHGAPLFWGDDMREAYCQPPVTPGHEFVGTVVAFGDNKDEMGDLSIGDQCTSEQIVPCWNCMYCKKGLYWLCKPHDIYGFHQCTQGGMAEYMIFPSGSLNYKIKKGIPAQHAAFVEPLSCAVHGVQRGNIEFGDTVVVSGCGAIGLGMIAAAKLKNPARIIALDMSDERLDVARECGAQILLNPGKCNVVEEVMKITDGYGCDVYLEATGHPSSVKQGLHMIRKMGNFVEFSVFGQETTVDWTIIGDTKELNIYGGHLSGNSGYKQAIHMVESGQLPVDRIVTSVLPTEEYLEAIDYCHRGVGIKTVLQHKH